MEEEVKEVKEVKVVVEEDTEEIVEVWVVKREATNVDTWVADTAIEATTEA